jgi:hypothetical protein
VNGGVVAAGFGLPRVMYDRISERSVVAMSTKPDRNVGDPSFSARALPVSPKLSLTVSTDDEVARIPFAPAGIVGSSTCRRPRRVIG